MSDIGIGLSGLLAAQRALRVTGNNIANVNTPGFTRRSVTLTPRRPDLSPIGPMGRGVEIRDVRRIRDAILDSRVRAQTATYSRAEVRHRYMSELESLFNEPSDIGLSSSLTRFFNSLQNMSTTPESAAARTQVLTEGKALATAINQLSNGMVRLQSDIGNETAAKISEANSLLSEIAALNLDISSMEAGGDSANDLRDRQESLILDLSKIIEVTTMEERSGVTNVLLNGHLLVSGSESATLIAPGTGAASGNEAVMIQFRGGVSADPVQINNGEIKGLLDMRTEIIPDVKSRLDVLASALIKEVNAVHSEGVGLSGGFSFIRSTNPVRDLNGTGEAADDPLSAAGLPFAPNDGELYVTLVNQATGAEEKSKISVNADDRLADIATALSAVTNLSAIVDNGTLTIAANDGYTFNFTKSLDPNPGLLGTSTVSVSGAYTGSVNDAYTFIANGAGQVGGTDGLQVIVKNSAGEAIATLDVGSDYTPGDFIAVAEGVSVSFSAGDIDALAPDSLTLDVVSDSDTSNILAALGINAFFSGGDASNIDISEDIQRDVSNIAAAAKPVVGDNSNALRLAAIERESVLDSGTFGQHFQMSVQEVGLRASNSERTERVQDLLLSSLQNRRDEISGVSIDEESVDLIRFQKAFQASAKFISVIDNLSQTLLNI